MVPHNLTFKLPAGRALWHIYDLGEGTARNEALCGFQSYGYSRSNRAKPEDEEVCSTCTALMREMGSRELLG